MKTEQINLPDIIGKGYASFWRNKNRYRVLKGGRGSKKSATAALWYIYNTMKHSKANTVVVRKTFNTHKDSTFAQLKWAAKRLGVFEKWRFTLSPLECTYIATGQKILFRGFDDPLKLTSITVDTGVLCWAWIEEAYELDDVNDFDTFDESIRGEMPDGLWKQVTLTYNPWVNSHWTKDRYFDKIHPDTFALTTTFKCNEFLDDQDRQKIMDLEFSNPDRYKVVGLGEYGIPGGQYFDEFRSDIHTIDSFVIPDEWRRYITLDYGLDMLACYWIAVDNQQKAYVYKELYQSNLIISDAAAAIKKANGSDNVYCRYAPPDLWNRRQETGKSAIEIFHDNGLMFVKSINNRVQGWYNVKEWLKPYDDEQGIKTAKLVITKNCINLIRTLPQLQSDERDPNDVADQPHELTHSGDSLRYFCSMRPLPIEHRHSSHYNFPSEQPKPDGVRGGEVSKSYLDY